MSEIDETAWQEANRDHLAASLAAVRRALDAHVARAGKKGAARGGAGAELNLPPAPELPVPPALVTLEATFDLSPFEVGMLLLCAGVELDAAFAASCAAAQGDPGRPYATFGLALAVLPGAGWEPLSPQAPLRAWRLIEVEPGPALTQSPLRIDERILHFLVGVQHLDERLAVLVEAVPPAEALVPSHQEIARHLAATWSRTVGSPDFPILQLAGEEVGAKRDVAAEACAELGLRLFRLPADALPGEPRELESLARLWHREAILTGSVLLLDCDELEPGESQREGAVQRFIDGIPGGLILSSRRRRRQRRKPLLTVEIAKPTPAEQRGVWRAVLGERAAALDGWIESLVAQFNLGAPTIHAVYAGALGRPDPDPPEELGPALWDTCRLQARPRLEDLTQRIDPAADWDDLVVPDLQRGTLQEIAAQMAHRGTVHGAWGFAAQGPRGLGISALFAGASGTGKTMASEVLARELNLDLFRIDLSSVVSKYIGETEKNLKRVFDTAEEGGAILLFDEADALFGRRSEVKDSHDRYANIEVSYLLQRLETYRGLAILTTNLKDALDSAFLRRFRFVVELPFPNAAQRAEIWRRVFPAATPTRDLDLGKLARLNLAGGSIRNIALNAAFLAAAERGPVTMRHLLRAARSEFAKLEKPLSEAETRDWT